MRNKILIVDANAGDREEFEKILQEVLQEGGELFFADKREDGITILQKEQPQIVFVDTSFVGDDPIVWTKNGGHLVLIDEIKPLNGSHVLKTCRTFLNNEPAAQVPPM